MEIKLMESRNKVTKIILTTVFFFNILMVSAQINLSFDQDCLNKNSILLSQFLLNTMGEEFVSDILEEGNHLLFSIDVDSLGRVVNVLQIRENRKNDFISDKLVYLSEEKLDTLSREKIISALKSSCIKFSLCHELIPGDSKSKAYERSKKWFKDNKTTYINVSSPGYRYFSLTVREEREKKGLSKLQIFKKWIEEND